MPLPFFPQGECRLLLLLLAGFQCLHCMSVAFLKTVPLVLHLLELFLCLLCLFSGGIIRGILLRACLPECTLPHALFCQLSFQFFLLSGSGLLQDTQFTLPHQQILQYLICLFVFLSPPCSLLFQGVPVLFGLFRFYLNRFPLLPQLHHLFRQGLHAVFHTAGLLSRFLFLLPQALLHLPAVENVVFTDCHRRFQLGGFFLCLLNLLANFLHFQRAFLHTPIAVLHLCICPLDLPFGILVFRLCL